LEGSRKGASLFTGAMFRGGPGRTWGGGLRGRTSFSMGALLGVLIGGLATEPCEALRWATFSIGAL